MFECKVKMLRFTGMKIKSGCHSKNIYSLKADGSLLDLLDFLSPAHMASLGKVAGTWIGTYFLSCSLTGMILNPGRHPLPSLSVLKFLHHFSFGCFP